MCAASAQPDLNLRSLHYLMSNFVCFIFCYSSQPTKYMHIIYPFHSRKDFTESWLVNDWLVNLGDSNVSELLLNLIWIYTLLISH